VAEVRERKGLQLPSGVDRTQRSAKRQTGVIIRIRFSMISSLSKFRLKILPIIGGADDRNEVYKHFM
jgi:hypothetical protein